jgi:hypothetical protein
LLDIDLMMSFAASTIGIRVPVISSIDCCTRSIDQ